MNQDDDIWDDAFRHDGSDHDTDTNNNNNNRTFLKKLVKRRKKKQNQSADDAALSRHACITIVIDDDDDDDDNNANVKTKPPPRAASLPVLPPPPRQQPQVVIDLTTTTVKPTKKSRVSAPVSGKHPSKPKFRPVQKKATTSKKTSTAAGTTTTTTTTSAKQVKAGNKATIVGGSEELVKAPSSSMLSSSSSSAAKATLRNSALHPSNGARLQSNTGPTKMIMETKAKLSQNATRILPQKRGRPLPSSFSSSSSSTTSAPQPAGPPAIQPFQQQQQPPLALAPPQSNDGMHLHQQYHHHQPQSPRKLCHYGIHCTFRSCWFLHLEERIMDRPQQTEYNNTHASQAREGNSDGPTPSRPHPPPPPMSRPSGYDHPHQQGGLPPARNYDMDRESPWKRRRQQPPQRMGPAELYPPRHPNWSSQPQRAHHCISRHAPPPPPPRRDPRNGPPPSNLPSSFPQNENSFQKPDESNHTTAADPLRPPPRSHGMPKRHDATVGTAAGLFVDRFHGANRSLADTDGCNNSDKGNSTQPCVDRYVMGHQSPSKWRKQKWHGVPHMVHKNNIHGQSRNDLNAESPNRKPPPVELEMQQCWQSEKHSHRHPIEKTTMPGDPIVHCNEMFQHPKALRIPSKEEEQPEKKSNKESEIKNVQESDYVPVPDAKTAAQSKNGSAILDRPSERSSLSVHAVENHDVTNRDLLHDEKDVIKNKSNTLIPGNSGSNSGIPHDDVFETKDDELSITNDGKKNRLVGEKTSVATARTPKASLHTLYRQKPRFTQITTKHFLTFDNGKTGKEKRFSSIFLCPLTHEAFLACPSFWYHRKSSAEQAAAAQAWNCIAMREGMGSDILFGGVKPYWPFQRPVWPFTKIPSHIIDQLPVDFRSAAILERDKRTVGQSDKQPENSMKTRDAKIKPKALSRDPDWDRELKKWHNRKRKAKAKQLYNERYRLLSEAEALFEDLIKNGTCTEKQVALIVVPYSRQLITSRLKSQDTELPTTLLQDIQTFVSSMLKKVDAPASSPGDRSESKVRQADGSGPSLGDDIHGTTEYEAQESINTSEGIPDSLNDSPCHASTNGGGNKKRNLQSFPKAAVCSTPTDDESSHTTNDVNDSISLPVGITTSDHERDTMEASDTPEPAHTMPEEPSSTTTDLGEVTPSVESAPTTQKSYFLSASDNIFDVIVEAARKDPSICNLSVSELLVDPKFHEKLRDEYPEIFDYQNERGSHLRTRFAETWIQLKMNNFGISANDSVIKGILDAANEDSTIYELSAGEVIDRFSTELKEQYTGIDNNGWWIHTQFESLWSKVKPTNQAKFANLSTKAKTTNTKPIKPIFKPRKRKKVEGVTDARETKRRNAANSNVGSETTTKTEGVHTKGSVNSSASVPQKAEAPPSSSVPEQRYVFHTSTSKESSSQNAFQTKKKSCWFDSFKSKEEAEQEQERLFAAAAARVRSQAKARVASAPTQARSSTHRHNRTFSTLVPDIHVAFPDHWQYTNSYARLGLPASATDIQIKTHYRRLARVYHPDKGGACSKPKFQAVTEAYHTLMNR